MKRLVEIVSWSGDPVLNAARHWPPGVVNNAKSRITMAHLVWGNHSQSNQIINLIQLDLLALELFPNGVKPLHPAFNPHDRNFGFLHLGFNSLGNPTQKS